MAVETYRPVRWYGHTGIWTSGETGAEAIDGLLTTFDTMEPDVTTIWHIQASWSEILAGNSNCGVEAPAIPPLGSASAFVRYRCEGDQQANGYLTIGKCTGFGQDWDLATPITTHWFVFENGDPIPVLEHEFVLDAADWGGAGYPDITDLVWDFYFDATGGPLPFIEIYDIRIEGVTSTPIYADLTATATLNAQFPPSAHLIGQASIEAKNASLSYFDSFTDSNGVLIPNHLADTGQSYSTVKGVDAKIDVNTLIKGD